MFEKIRNLATSLMGVSESPHFEKMSFRVNKKIFATFDQTSNQLTLKFSEKEQHVFSSIQPSDIFPVPNKWGKQGWTYVQPENIHPDLLADMIRCAYEEVSLKK